ncbi:MAG: 50S ribosomal protein L29 [Anaerolineales bacterium]|nr:MAG: 50S ribosomal protein L29 [Anaerolineales bacterium]
MKIDEIRALSTDELRGRLEDTREELMNLRFQTVIGGLTDHTRLRFTRRTIARMMTVLKEREMVEYQEGEE